MGKRQDISNERKLRITALLDIGYISLCTIAKKEEVSRQAVQRMPSLVKKNVLTTNTGRRFYGKETMATY